MMRLIPSHAAGAIVAATLAMGAVFTAAPTAVLAQPVPAAAPAALVGKVVRDVDGKTLGVIEKVITAGDGRIRQVQVRTRKGPVTALRTLPFSSLRADGDAFTSVLTQGEFDAIPVAPDQ